MSTEGHWQTVKCEKQLRHSEEQKEEMQPVPSPVLQPITQQQARCSRAEHPPRQRRAGLAVLSCRQAGGRQQAAAVPSRSVTENAVHSCAAPQVVCTASTDAWQLGAECACVHCTERLLRAAEVNRYLKDYKRLLSIAGICSSKQQRSASSRRAGWDGLWDRGGHGQQAEGAARELGGLRRPAGIAARAAARARSGRES